MNTLGCAPVRGFSRWSSPRWSRASKAGDVEQTRNRAGAVGICRARRRAVPAPAGIGTRRRAWACQRLPQALREEGAGQGPPGAGPALCLLSDAARFLPRSRGSPSSSCRIHSPCSGGRKPTAWRPLRPRGARGLRPDRAHRRLRPCGRSRPFCGAGRRFCHSRRSLTRTFAVERFAGAPVVRNMDLLAPPPDAVLVTDMHAATTTVAAADSKVRRGARSRARPPWRAADRPTEECMTAAGPSWSVAQTHAQANPAPAQAPRPPSRPRISSPAPPWHEDRARRTRAGVRTAAGLHLASDRRAVQAGGLRRRLGGAQPAPEHARVHVRLRQPSRRFRPRDCRIRCSFCRG